MKSSNFRLAVFISIFSLGLGLPGLNAQQELPFDNPNITVSMDLQNASLKDVLKLLSVQSGLNFVASEGVKDRTLTLYFDKVQLQQAMDQLFKANNLAYDLDRDSSIFIVKDLGKPQVELETRVFYLKYASVSSSHIMEEVENNIGSESSSSSSTASTSTTSSTSGTETSAEGNRYGVASDIGITTAVKRLLSKDGSVIEDYRTNSLIVQDVPTRMPMIAQTIAALDVSTPQVLIEVEMLDVSKNLVDKLGFKFGQTPFSLVLTGASLPTSWPFGGSNGFKDLVFGKAITAGSIGVNSLANNANAYTVALDFLKTQSDTKFLARPRLLTLNNETAEFFIKTNETLNIENTTLSGASITSQTSNVPIREETGVNLRVTPQINSDTGEITMFIMPKVKDTSSSSLSSTSVPIKDPEERTIKSIVRIKDGETIILGGLIRNKKSETITKLPFFGDLPVFGALFRNKNKDQDIERELLVFITPHIVKDKKAAVAKANSALPKLPVREQDAVAVIDRQATINTSLNNFGKK